VLVHSVLLRQLLESRPSGSDPVSTAALVMLSRLVFKDDHRESGLACVGSKSW